MKKLLPFLLSLTIVPLLFVPTMAQQEAKREKAGAKGSSLPRCRALVVKEMPGMQKNERFLTNRMDELAKSGRCIL